MGEAESDEETIVEQHEALKQLSIEVEKQQLLALLSGEADINDCFLEIHAGAGGTEAQDWAECCCGCMSAGVISMVLR